MARSRSRPGDRFSGERLRTLRRARGYSQRELAEKAGVSLATVALAEGDKQIPYPSTIRLFARALGVEPFYFCEGGWSSTGGG